MEKEVDSAVLSLYNDFKKSIASKDIDIDRVDRAFLYTYKKHKGQMRESGESYIIHPINVAMIASKFYLDENSIIAALLHDVLEDTDTKEEEIEKEFGSDVLFLVVSLTKIGKIEYKNKEEKQADNFRKMIVAMARDLRVILIKLADRLHNMRTICYLNKERQCRIGRETMDVYAPIAHRLGMYAVKSELEDLSFKYLYSEEYDNLKKKVERGLEKRLEIISFIESKIKQDMKEANIECEIQGRIKHLYSIYSKMKRNRVDFESIYDLMALRIITKSEKDCYAALGIIHKYYKPLPGRFKDYIAIPKQNMYQSLHTTIFGPSDAVIEIQIRTKKMHEIAEEGIAAHYRYKEGSVYISKYDKQFLWLRHLLKWQKEVNDPREFLNTVRVDLFRGEVYIFTPTGDLKILPRGSTPVDFAYAIHTEVGNSCVGAKINGKMVPLKTQLSNGDIVEIHTQNNHTPSRDWLSFVVTSKAKSKIRQKVREKEKKEAAEIGKGMLARELLRVNHSLQEFLKEEKFESVMSYFGSNTKDELFQKIGFLKVHASSVIDRIYPENRKKQVKTVEKKNVYKINVDGIDNVVFKLAKCCDPIYGDDVVGYVTKGRGVVIHRIDCENVKKIGYDSDRLIDVEWEYGNKKLPVNLKVLVMDKIGILATITDKISKLNINTKDIKIKYLDEEERKVLISIQLEVKDKAEIDKLIDSLKKEESILKIDRSKTYK